MLSILALIAYYGNDRPMQQAYSILVQSESSYMRSPYQIKSNQIKSNQIKSFI